MGRRQIPVEAMGEFPHPSGVIQVIDDKAFDAILAQKIPAQGLLVDFDHYSDLRNEDRLELEKRGIQLPSKAAGWIKGFVKRVADGITRLYADVDFTPEGERAIADKSYLHTSPVHPGHALEYLGDSKVRPRATSKVALTNEPNIGAIGPIFANRALLSLANSAGKDPGDLCGDALQLEDKANVENQQGEQPSIENRKQRKPKMEQIAQFLGCEATEDAVLAAVKPIKEAADLANRAASVEAEEARKAELDALKNRAEAAEAKLEEIQKKAEEDAINARIAAELAKYPDLPNRAEAEGILRKDFELGSKFLAGLPKPSAAAVPGQSPEDLANRDAPKKPVCIFNC